MKEDKSIIREIVSMIVGAKVSEVDSETFINTSTPWRYDDFLRVIKYNTYARFKHVEHVKANQSTRIDVGVNKIVLILFNLIILDNHELNRKWINFMRLENDCTLPGFELPLSGIGSWQYVLPPGYDVNKFVKDLMTSIRLLEDPHFNKVLDIIEVDGCTDINEVLNRIGSYRNISDNVIKVEFSSVLGKDITELLSGGIDISIFDDILLDICTWKKYYLVSLKGRTLADVTDINYIVRKRLEEGVNSNE